MPSWGSVHKIKKTCLDVCGLVRSVQNPQHVAVVHGLPDIGGRCVSHGGEERWEKLRTLGSNVAQQYTLDLSFEDIEELKETARLLGATSLPGLE